jgi:error-prone DNA polymerase
VHHQAAFTCSILNSQPMGFYSASSLVRDAQAHGVEVRPACVVRSAWDNLLEREGERVALRLGLRQIKGMPEAAAKAIVAVREEAKLSSLADLVRRAGLKKNEVEALAEAGALAALVLERREALWRARAPRAGGLFEGTAIEADEDVGLPPASPLEQLVLDYGRVGLSIEDHPMKHLRAGLDRTGVKRAVDLREGKHGEAVTVAGLVIGRQRPATASGITFVTLEDETGTINLIVHKSVFASGYAVARHAKLLLVRGKLEKEGGVIHVLARTMERLGLPRGKALDAKSRDFR